jgi:glycosyltransferase involved in cell wall biosynthesis
MVTYRRPDWLPRSIGAVLEQTIPPSVLVVVDNDADPDVRSYLERLHPPDTTLHYASTPSNVGPAGGLQRGLEALAQIDPDARVEHVLFLDDDDPLPTPDIVALLLQLCLDLAGPVRVGAVGVVGGRWDDRRACIRRPADSELSGAVPVDYIGGGQAPVYDRAALDEIGGVDGSLFFGFDDLDLGLRLKRAGYALYAHGDMWRHERVRHGRLGLGPQSTRPGPEMPWRSYYSARNLVLILRAQRSSRQAIQASVRQILGGLRQGSCLRSRLRGLFDAWLGRRGIRVLPEQKP